MIGQTVSHYRIIEKLGGGGMGVVYKAQDSKLDRFVALKFLPPDMTLDSEAKERFIHEAQAASALQHSNICTVHDIEETDEGQLFIVMDCYDGETLKSRIARSRLEIEEAVNIAIQLAQGLSRAHEAGIIHRDIKPANIMITSHGEVKIVDFGLAKLAGRTLLTKSGSTLGTAAYMSPEQARGEQVDERTDIWSLGIVLYEMLTGKRPFESEYEQALVYSILNQDPRPVEELNPDVPENIIGIVQRASEKDKEKRFQTAAEMAEALRGEGKLQRKRMSRRRKRMLWYAAALGILVAAVLTIFFTMSRADVIDSVAVLPFENLSKDSTLDFYSDGLTDELITKLYSVGSLSVRSTQTMMRFKNTRKSPQEIAKELKVKALLTGTVMRSGSRVRLSFQLTNALSEKNIWGDSYEKKSADVLIVISEVSQAVVREVKLKLTPQEQTLLASSPKVDPKALDFYLKGRIQWNKRSPKGIANAIELFKTAISYDPNYTLAYAGLADCYVVPANPSPPRERMPQAKSAALKAIDLDENLAEAHASLAYIKTRYDRDWEGAEREFKRAIELNANYATAHQWYANFLVAMSRFDEAKSEAQKATKLDPLSPIIHGDAALVFYMSRDYDSALQQALNALELDTTLVNGYTFIMEVYIAKKRFPDAMQIHLRWLELSRASEPFLGALRNAYERSNWYEYTKICLDRALETARQRYVDSYLIAKLFAMLGEKDRAIQFLQQACEARDYNLTMVNVNPCFDALHDDERFVALVKKMGLKR